MVMKIRARGTRIWDSTTVGERLSISWLPVSRDSKKAARMGAKHTPLGRYPSHLDHDLSKLPIRFQVAVRIDDSIKRKNFGDDWLECTAFESICNELSGFF